MADPSSLPSGAMPFVELRHGTNLIQVAEYLATADSAAYCTEHMLKSELAGDDFRLLARAVDWCSVDGMILEFGVASGRTINHLADLCPDHTVFGFDWFQGLPETWRPGFGRGRFANHVPIVRPNVVLVEGLFEQTLADFLANRPEPVALLHIDCDLYSSTRFALNTLATRIGLGTIIVFDEYFNYPGWRKHEFKAFAEFVADHDLTYDYLGFVPTHQQVCVRISG
jgi:Methyltransferase domain